MNADLINGLFECFGAVFICLSIYRLLQDKKVMGISLWHPLFFWVWGVWNLFFYPAVGAWLSFYGGIAVLITNSIWFGLVIYYKRKRAKWLLRLSDDCPEGLMACNPEAERSARWEGFKANREKFLTEIKDDPELDILFVMADKLVSDLDEQDREAFINLRERVVDTLNEQISADLCRPITPLEAGQ